MNPGTPRGSATPARLRIPRELPYKATSLKPMPSIRAAERAAEVWGGEKEVNDS